MNYELAKKLKDAGFPQNGKVVNKKAFTFDGVGKEYAIEDTDEVFYFPTLSELIEACGDGFNVLIRSTFLTKGVKPEFRASSGSGGAPSSEGKTPEEAVALLYLKLHEK